MRHTSHAVPDAAASAVEMPTHRQPHSAVPGPASHASRRYSARPPSSGRTGSRLKAHSTPLAPAAVVHTSSCRGSQPPANSPTAPPEPIPTPARSPWPPGPRSPLPTCRPAAAEPPRRRALKPADARTRATLPPPAPSAPSANRSRGRTIPPAEKSRRRRYTQAVST